jgi:hypothetical protein
MFDIIVAVCAIVGQISHIVKKRTQEGKSEMSVLQRWVIKRPVNTLVASAGAVVAAHALQIPNGPVLESAASAFIAGYAADSLANRPG